jgi:hypothetical protein
MYENELALFTQEIIHTPFFKYIQLNHFRVKENLQCFVSIVFGFSYLSFFVSINPLSGLLCPKNENLSFKECFDMEATKYAFICG